MNILLLFKQILRELEYFLVDKITRFTKFRKYRFSNSLRLNLGSGSINRDDFINIDLNKNADLRLDLRKSLPFKENSVDYIYSEHFFEHLDYINGTALRSLFSYLKVLKKGGKLKIVVPDFEKILRAYVNKDLVFFNSIRHILDKINICEGYSSIIDFINYSVYQFGEHKYCYDYEKMCLLLEFVGFKNIIKSKFDPLEDSIDRKKFSMYIIAEK